jgi:hypothetical protein
MKIRKTRFNSLFEALSASVQLKKMTDWHNGNRRENVAAMGNDKLLFNYNICVQAGFTKEANILAGFIKNRGLSIPGSASTSVSTSASTSAPVPASTSASTSAHNGNSGKYRVISTSQPGQYVGEIGVSKKGSIYKWTGKSWSAVGRKQSKSTTHTSTPVAASASAPSVSSIPSTQSTSSTYRQISTSKHNGAYDDPGQYIGEIGQTRRGSLYKWSGKSWAPYKDPASNSNTDAVSEPQTAPNEPISQAEPASEPIKKPNPEPEPEEPFNPIILNDIKSIDELKKQLGITGKMNMVGKYDTASKKYISDNNSIYHFIDKFIKDNRIGFLFTRNINYNNNNISYSLKTHNSDHNSDGIFFYICGFLDYTSSFKNFQCYIYELNANESISKLLYEVDTRFDDKYTKIKVDPSDSESISKYMDLEKLLYYTCNAIIKYAKAKQLSNPDYFDLKAKLERKSSQIVPLNRDFDNDNNILTVGASESKKEIRDHRYIITYRKVEKDSGHEIYCTKKFNIPLYYQDYLSGEFRIIKNYEFKIEKINTKPLLDKLLNADDIIKNTFTILSLIKDNADNLSFIPNISSLMAGNSNFTENFANFMYIITPKQAFDSYYYDLAYNIAIFMHIDHINKYRRNLYYYVPLQNKIIKCEVYGRNNTSDIVAVEDADFDNPGKIFKEALGMSRNINTLVKL